MTQFARVPTDAGAVVTFSGDDGRVLRLGTGELGTLRLAHAISIHKSQGSEYPAVVLLLHTQHWMLLERNLLYTAITRGKQLVVLVGTRKALSLAIQRQDTRRRYSGLCRRLMDR